MQARFLLISLHLHPPQFDQDETDKRNNIQHSNGAGGHGVDHNTAPARTISGVFFLVKKTDFWLKNHFSAKRKNGRFSVIPAETRSVIIVGHLFVGPDCR